MDDEIKHNNDEEEFQFTEVEEPELYEAEPRPSFWDKVAWSSYLNRSNAIILIGAIILALAFYKLWGIFSAPKAPVRVARPPIVVQAPVTAPQPVSPTVTELQQLQQQMSADQEKVNNLENNMNTLSNSVTSLQQSLDGIKNQLSEVMTQLKTQQEEIQTLKPKCKVKPSGPIDFCPPLGQVKKIKKIERIKYYIKAVVPGRAWLVMPNGHTVSVAEGDRLPGYGKIVAISAVNSTVTTSSGTIIRYRVNVSTTTSPYI